MDPTDENEPGVQPAQNPKKHFPPGFENIENMVREGKQRIKDIDEKISGLKGEKGPTPQYNPPGFIGSRPTISKEQQATLLKQQKEQVQAEIWEKVDHEAKKASPDTAKAIREKTLDEVYPDLKRNEKDAAKLDMSQDYLNEQILKARERKAEKTQEGKNDPSYSMSFRFSQTLSYPTMDEGAGGGGSSSKEKDKEKDDPEP